MFLMKQVLAEQWRYYELKLYDVVDFHYLLPYKNTTCKQKVFLPCVFSYEITVLINMPTPFHNIDTQNCFLVCCKSLNRPVDEANKCLLIICIFKQLTLVLIMNFLVFIIFYRCLLQMLRTMLSKINLNSIHFC